MTAPAGSYGRGMMDLDMTAPAAPCGASCVLPRRSTNRESALPPPLFQQTLHRNRVLLKLQFCVLLHS
eukprot:5046737-Amphidinium_carterae.1